ncbi:MAG: hypothetical protein DRQ88_11735 [Epsilonproteobacteria bacterium]|nr:MAG: hypothetical protein DRQ88_11735 [Campylobacterota bacterium]
MNPIEELYTELSKILSPYKDNLQKLADETGVSKVTLWRWSTKSNTSYPDVDRVLRVLAKIAGLNKRKDIANYYGGTIEDFILKDSCPISSSYNIEILDSESPTQAITDFYSFLLFSICGTERGATEEELINVIGNIAIKKSGFPKADVTQELINAHGSIASSKIKDLVRKEIIARNEQGRFHRTIKNITIDLETSMIYLPQVMEEMLKPEEFNRGCNAIFAYTESISPELANELAIDTKKFFKRCYEKMEAGKTTNGIPYTIINFAERLWFDSLDGSLEAEVQS